MVSYFYIIAILSYCIPHSFTFRHLDVITASMCNPLVVAVSDDDDDDNDDDDNNN